MDYRSSQSDHLVPRLMCNQFLTIWENTSPLESALVMHVFLAMPGLLCCTQASPGCSEQGMRFSGRVWAFHCCGFSCYRAWALEHRLQLVAHGLSCPAACGFFPDQGWNLCPLHWEVGSWPLEPPEVSVVCLCWINHMGDSEEVLYDDLFLPFFFFCQGNELFACF